MRTSTASARAYVATTGFVPRSRSSPIRSAAADSPIPLSRSVTVAVSLPSPRSRSRGTTQPDHIGRISRGGPGRATMSLPSGRSTHQPGAVPCSFGIAVAERISHACLRLISRNGRPRRSHRRRSQVSSSASTATVSPQAAAIASRVRSSGVGPRPPVETTRWARTMPAAKASRTISRSSGTPVRRVTRTPAAVSQAANSPAFVSRVSPVVSSEPTDNSSAVRRGALLGTRRSVARRPVRSAELQDGRLRGSGVRRDR